jgi:flagella basal body P-ring formation protein FlgA
MHGNGRPLGTRKRIQVLLAVVLLAWATQTLLHQWGFGAEIELTGTGEKFVSGAARYAAGAVLELRGDATIVGVEVRLKQIARWSDADAALFAPVADLVVTRANTRSPIVSITIEQLRNLLRDAGMNLALVHFAGPTVCTITRSDANYDEQSALREWATGKTSTADLAQVQAAPQDKKIAPIPIYYPPPKGSAEVKSLRSFLIDDLSTRLGLPAEQLQVSFNPKDESLLRLSEPLFKFNIEPRQVHDLGDVSWTVTVLTGTGSQKGMITANARAWQNQVVVEKSLAYHQVIRAADVTEKRVLVDRRPPEPLLNVSQVVGQEAARDLKTGMVISSHMVDPVALVKPGQLVTISLSVGTVSVKTVGRALEGGAFGQTVKVKNDTTQDIYEVTLTAPQEGTMGPLPSNAVIADARTH